MRMAILALAAATALAGCSSSAELTESQEYYVGRAVAAGAMADPKTPLSADLTLEEYVAMVGLSISFESDRPETFKGYHFAVLDSRMVNAFAAPSGFIFVTTGALRIMESEDELAGVLAHEVAHVNLRHPEHVAQRATQSAGVSGLLGGVAGLAALGAGVVGKKSGTGRSLEDVAKLAEGLGKVTDSVGEAMVKGYGRDSEFQADAMGVDLMSRLGYDPAALKKFVSKLPKHDGGPWATHPELDGRLQAIDQAIKKKGARTAVDPARTERFKAMTAGLKGP